MTYSLWLISEPPNGGPIKETRTVVLDTDRDGCPKDLTVKRRADAIARRFTRNLQRYKSLEGMRYEARKDGEVSA